VQQAAAGDGSLFADLTRIFSDRSQQPPRPQARADLAGVSLPAALLALAGSGPGGEGEPANKEEAEADGHAERLSARQLRAFRALAGLLAQLRDAAAGGGGAEEGLEAHEAVRVVVEVRTKLRAPWRPRVTA